MSCKQVQKVTDVITNPSASEILERGFENNDSVFQQYKLRYNNAKKNRLKLVLPTVIASKADSKDLKILAYTINLRRGEHFKIESNIDADTMQLAIDVYAIENDSVIAEKPMVSNQPKTNELAMKVERTSNYKVVIWHEQKPNTDFALMLFTEPSLAFPVSGKGNKAIQSFWGAPRGGGTRSHKGIDIFAKRGTPVVAATDGFISDTGNRGLGGKQVWLRDRLFGQSLYYAHLDSIVVSGGNRVRVGDTLGFVGNTGNAKTTPPHLHFGIYTRGGAIDPLPFVKQTKAIEFDDITVTDHGETKLKINELRVGAGVENEKIQNIKPNVTVNILGQTKQWLHLKVNDTLEGFMHQSLVRKVR